MAALDKASARLMKPAKDLADWNFPLASILEEYYTLLKEQRDVNFSNAALVLQNSANVYMRRIEYLYQDTNSLNESFAVNEAAQKTNSPTKRGRDKNSLHDFGDFDSIDFTTFVGRSNNIKNRSGDTNTVKLLSQRFPQLENISRSSLPIEVYDIHGEVVGRKYDFRCNEYLTVSGMLVEHLTPEDFPNNSRSSSIPAESPSVKRAFTESDARDLCQSSCEDSLALHDKDLLDASFASSFDSGISSCILSLDSARPDSALSSIGDNPWEQPPSRPGSSLSTGAPTPLSSPREIDVTQSTEKRNGEEAQEYSSQEYGEEECNEENSQGGAPLQTRRSKRLKNAIDTVNELNPKEWEPIPFHGVPDKLPKARSEFRLPCPVSLLKFKERPRKRRSSAQAKKKRCLERMSTSECCSPRKKMTMYSPTRPLFPSMKTEEFEGAHTFLEEFLEKRSTFGAFNYEAVTDISMDLLGYRNKLRKVDREKIARVQTGFETDVSKLDDVIHNIVSTVNDSTEPDEAAEPVLDDFPMPDTPESSDSSSEPDLLPSVTSPKTFNSRIEQSVRNIYDNANVRNDQDESVIRWHEFMKPKLREADRRPPFDMKQYSARLIEKMKTQRDRKIEFKEIVTHHEPTEVARYFLASLQLANKYNLHIDTSRNVDGNFTLVLLDEDRMGDR